MAAMRNRKANAFQPYHGHPGFILFVLAFTLLCSHL